MTSGTPRRDVGSSLVMEVVDPTAFVLAVAVAEGVPTTVETLRVRLDDDLIETREATDEHGTRLHLFETGPGILSVDYAATVVGRAAPTPVVERDLVRYLRPSRYVQSDALTDRARELFPGLDGLGLLTAVEDWVHANLSYDGNATSPIGGAVETLQSGAGVCRDFANVTAAFLRALDVPARLVSVYAPLLEPRDFHAVVEACVGDRWLVVDATRLAPRSGLVRIATGRDSADTAFVTNTLADVTLLTIDVRATADIDPRRRSVGTGRARLGSGRKRRQYRERGVDDVGRLARFGEGLRRDHHPEPVLEDDRGADATLDLEVRLVAVGRNHRARRERLVLEFRDAVLRQSSDRDVHRAAARLEAPTGRRPRPRRRRPPPQCRHPESSRREAPGWG